MVVEVYGVLGGGVEVVILLVVGVVGILVVDVLGVVDEEVGVVEVDNEVDLQVDEEHLQRFIA